jgi:hypothetical protein
MSERAITVDADGSMLTKLREFHVSELALLARLAIAAPLRRRELRRTGFRPNELASLGGAGAEDIAKARRLGRIVNIAVSRAAGPENCLLRSLMLIRLLDRHRIAGIIRLGALPDRPFATAHAWVEVGSEPVNDTLSNIARFVQFIEPQRTKDV